MKWKSLTKQKPHTYLTGNWDGKKSDQVIIERKDGSYNVAVCYEGRIDGEYFFDWYEGPDEFELDISEIRRWIEIPD